MWRTVVSLLKSAISNLKRSHSSGMRNLHRRAEPRARHSVRLWRRRNAVPRSQLAFAYAASTRIFADHVLPLTARGGHPIKVDIAERGRSAINAILASL